jgi:hypothetical protein
MAASWVSLHPYHGGDRVREMTVLFANAESVAAFRRGYRWLNLTLIQQGVWPLLLVVFGAPVTPVPLTPLPWYWARLAPPVLAALLALAYVAQRPHGLASEAVPHEERSFARGGRWRQQVRLVILGVTVAVAAWRLVEGPFIPVLKLEAVGLADALAFQIINFGVVGRVLGSGAMRLLPVATFGLAWGLRDLFLTLAIVTVGNPVLAFVGGFIVGVAVGAVSFGLRRWPGGAMSAIACQFLIVSLIFGFWRPG